MSVKIYHIKIDAFLFTKRL